VTCGVAGCSRGGLLAWSRVERGHTPTYPGGDNGHSDHKQEAGLKSR
jgi:hypothetical protein